MVRLFLENIKPLDVSVPERNETRYRSFTRDSTNAIFRRGINRSSRHRWWLLQEIPRNPLTSEPTRSTVISVSPRVHSPRSASRSDGLYAFEASSCETSFNGDSRSREIIDTDVKMQEIYRSPAPFVSSNQIAPLTGTLQRSNEPPFQNTSNALARLLPASNDSIITSRNGEYTTQPVTTATKPELSHPISRLCDTIESDERKETSVANTSVEKKNGEEKITRIFVNSDSNNNNETIISTEVTQRGRSTDDHRCDQCGKTFVTRASLKVYAQKQFHYYSLFPW